MLKIPTLEARTPSKSGQPGQAKTASSGSSGSGLLELVAVFQDSGRKAIAPRGSSAALVEKLRRDEIFNARHGAMQYLKYTGKTSAENYLLLGLGAAAELTEERLRVAAGHAWTRAKAEHAKAIAVELDSFFDARGMKAELTHAKIARAFAEGLVLGAYQYQRHRSVKGDSAEASYAGPSRISFITRDASLKKSLDAELKRAAAIAEAVRITRDWSNEPSNFGTPEFFAAEARKLARQYGLRVRVLGEREMKAQKMGLMLGVGQGAERESRVVVLEYVPRGVKKPKTLALVGKGVTFDSGGISIKPSMRMEDMKHDMTGAATVAGAVVLASLWKVPNRVVAVMGFVENMPDGNAIQPGNVLTSRSGKTVEIINTDAEGRLVLADLLDWVQDQKPDAIVDAATLTGAVSIALGKQCCAILGSDETLVDSVIRAGEANGERIWELPLYDEYFEDLKSDWADMKNSANDSYGGTIRGAIFLRQYIRKGIPWAHLDIAATAYNMAHHSYYPKKGASGAYVRTLAQLAADF